MYAVRQEVENSRAEPRSRGTVTPWTRDTVIAFTLLHAGAPTSTHTRARSRGRILVALGRPRCIAPLQLAMDSRHSLSL